MEEKVTAEVSNDAALSKLTEFQVKYNRSISISFQSWRFEHSQTLSFSPSDTPDQRRALIHKISQFVRIAVLQDIAVTMPEIEATIGDQPQVVETLKRSLGFL